MRKPSPPIRTPFFEQDGATVSRSWVRHFADIAASQFSNLPVYANNAAALAGGLKPGDAYRTGADPDVVCVVH